MNARQTAQKKQPPRISRLYRSGTFIFLGISLLVGAAIAAIAFSRTTILVTLAPRDITETATVTVSEQPREGGDDLPGKLLFSTGEGEAVSAVPASGATVDDYAHGNVTINNTWTKTQPLAATTRLRPASNGLIFRTTKRVDVPAGGSVVTEIAADEKGAKGNVPPGRFEIVALWQGLKDKIWGESTEPMSGGRRSQAAVTQALIDDAKKNLERELLNKVQTAVPTPPDGMSIVGEPTIAATTLTPSANPGDAVQAFTVKGSVRAVQVAVEDNAVSKKITGMLETAHAKDEEVSATSVRTTWNVIEFNERERTARFDLNASASARLKQDSKHLKPEQFSRKTRSEILQTLLGIPGVKSADVRMSPFWATRAPSLPSQIKIIVSVQE